MTRPGDQRLALERADTGNGGIGRDRLAEILIRSLLNDSRQRAHLELFAEHGPALADWTDLSGALTDDQAERLDGAGNRRRSSIFRAGVARWDVPEPWIMNA